MELWQVLSATAVGKLTHASMWDVITTAFAWIGIWCMCVRMCAASGWRAMFAATDDAWRIVLVLVTVQGCIHAWVWAHMRMVFACLFLWLIATVLFWGLRDRCIGIGICIVLVLHVA